MSSSRMRIAPAAFAVAVGVVAAGGGCNLVVGSSDYKVSTTGDGGGVTGPDAATDGGVVIPPPGDDGGTPPVPDAGSEPDTGTPPPVDSGTTTPDGAMPGPVCGANGAVLPNGLPTGDPAFQQLVKACVLAVSCDPLYFDVTISDCITNDYLHSHETSDCLSKITSCADYFACTGSRAATKAECQSAYDSDTAFGSCSSSGVATSCSWSGFGTISNCAALGGTCTVYHDPDYATYGETWAGCELGTCTDSTTSAPKCGTSTQVYTCQSTDTTTNLAIGRQSCGAGSTCQSTGGLATCADMATACTTLGASCSGNTLTTCQAVGTGKQQYTTNCAAAGLQCTPGLGTGACTAAGCVAANCTEGCTNNQLTVCIGGAPFAVDCPSLGFASCDYGYDANDTTFNYCSYR